MAEKMVNAKLSSVYYSPQGYWEGFTAISKLAQAAHVSNEVASEWLGKQSVADLFTTTRLYSSTTLCDLEDK